MHNFLSFYLFDCNFHNRTPFDDSVNYSDGVIPYKYYCYYYYMLGHKHSYSATGNEQ